MAEVRFARLGGDVITTTIDTKMSVRSFMEQNKDKFGYKEGDDIRIGGKSVSLDSEITPEQATLITAVPKIKGGN